MELLLLSFVAGILTVAAPCILPLLPVIVGGSVVRGQAKPDKQPDWRRPVVIAASLAVSVIVFGMLIKATTALLGVPQIIWQLASGLIVLFFGISLLFPPLWKRLAVASGLHSASSRLMAASDTRQGTSGDVVMGFALGPVFNSCSPTYALIIATILPVSFTLGLVYLSVYAVGLAGALLVIAFAGQSVVNKLGWLSNPSGWFKKTIGILFIVVGLAVVFGLDKKVQEFVLERGWHDPIFNIEQSLQ